MPTPESESERRAEGTHRPDPRPTYNADGVDLTQIRASLARTPLERLRENDEGVRLLELLRRARR